MIAGTVILKKIWKRAGEASEKLFQGEITINKRDFWLAGAALLLAGVVLGFIYAPLTHGVHIEVGSHNGNHNGNDNGNDNGNHYDESTVSGERGKDKREE